MFILVNQDQVVGITDGNSEPPSGYNLHPLPDNCTQPEQVYFNRQVQKVLPKPPKPTDGRSYTWTKDGWQPLIDPYSFVAIPDDGLLEEETFKTAIKSNDPEVVKWLAVAMYADAQNRYPLLAKAKNKLKAAIDKPSTVPTIAPVPVLSPNHQTTPTPTVSPTPIKLPTPDPLAPTSPTVKPVTVKPTE